MKFSYLIYRTPLNTEQDYLKSLVDDALCLDDIYNLLVNFIYSTTNHFTRGDLEVHLNKLLETVTNTIDSINIKFSEGLTELRNGINATTEENITFYEQAYNCIYSYYENRRMIVNELTLSNE